MAEIHVAPERRNRTVGWIVLAALILGAVAWYFVARTAAVATPGV